MRKVLLSWEDWTCRGSCPRQSSKGTFDDCLADVAVLRSSPETFGPVASDPTIFRLVSALAAAGPKAVRAIRAA